ncbi:MAG: hypothetical protein ACYTHK_14085 [Planctomycetota bacterium]|jgi:hypothetical protein
MRNTTLGILTCLALTACKSAPEEAAIGKGSVTVYPVIMLGKPQPEVAKVVAVLLERGGLEQIELASDAYTPDADDFDAQSRGFACYAKQQSIETEYALFGVYVGSPETGVAEVRGVLVDGTGNVLWSDCQRPGDRDFDRVKPNNPMSCTKLLVERLRKPLELEDPFRVDAPRGKIDRQMQRQSGIPNDAERAAMRDRAGAVKKGASVVVYPTLVGAKFEPAAALVASINERGHLKARPGETVRFAFRGNMNQQKVLWSAARSIQEQVRTIKPDADYVLFTHYVIARGGKKAFGVHTFLLDRNGEFVVVDYQNSHHDDFKRINPHTSADCAKLAVVRLAGYLE